MEEKTNHSELEAELIKDEVRTPTKSPVIKPDPPPPDMTSAPLDPENVSPSYRPQQAVLHVPPDHLAGTPGMPPIGIDRGESAMENLPLEIPVGGKLKGGGA